ncbi:MAG: c-type cytochrome [Burkholderiales bacterium]
MRTKRLFVPCVGGALLIALAGATAASAQTAAAPERSGKQVVDALCISCHGTGNAGAPKIGDQKAWAPLIAKGLTALSKAAMSGTGNMPSHGGNMKLSDIEVERAITYMVNQSGGRWTEPVSRTAATPPRSGQQIVDQRCASCHATGAGGAPKIGDRSAWTPRASKGLDTLVASAIHGHGAMPPRGGMADLTDAEVRAAVVYMMNAGSGAKQ